jgi:hypothetical protein
MICGVKYQSLGKVSNQLWEDDFAKNISTP